MPRLIARFVTASLLLLLALVGSFAPLALAASAPPHACCIRKAAHHCHAAADADSTQLVIHDAGCCHGDCCRALTSAQWAHAQPEPAAFFLQTIHSRLAASQPNSPATVFTGFHSSRAPPAC